ncbi:hypothetical protein BDN70DRAFT_57620 [Pholiota conissans]|uniref:F-box domain-containing protein n=1 Tax=Pholiota conissans TaxID=109636 RepID=A0A9P6CZ57_9AGAR|nr:hypothetical protein BDN70DRAFT_57620 [Pholiota conissans]
MAVSIDLPQETLEEIIDFLYDDRQALLTCSLASRKLVPVCRYHLFSEVSLESNRLCRFLELLDVPWSSFANMVSKIIVNGPRQISSPTRTKAAPIQPDYVPDDNSRLRERLSRVSAVRFINLCPGDIPASFWRLLEEMKAIKAIEAHRVAFRCPNNFFGYLSSLPLLEKLSITRPAMTLDSRWEQHLGDDYLTNRTPGNLVRVPLLDIRRLSDLPEHPSQGVKAGQAVLGWLLDQNPMPFVHSLRFNLDNNEEMTTMLRRYFNGNGSTVRKLWITLPANVNVLRGMPTVDFSLLKEVRCLHIEGLLMSHQSSTAMMESFFRGLFAQLFSSFIQTSIIDSSKPTPPPPIQRISVSLKLDAKGTYSFSGMPEYAVLQSVTWCKLPHIIEEALAPFPDKFEGLEVALTVKSTISDAQMELADMCVRNGVWKRFSEKTKFRVGFLPINGIDVDEDGI